MASIYSSSLQSSSSSSSTKQCLEKTQSFSKDEQIECHNVEALVSVIRQGSKTDRKTAFTTLQTLFQNPQDSPVDDLLAMESLPVFVDCLETSDDHESQLSALVVFAHITSGTKQHSQAVVTSGAVLPFIKLVDSPSLQIAEQALICVGNIACEDSFTRKVLYENGGLHAVIRFIQRSELSADQLNSGAWAFSNMCRSRSLIAIDVLEVCTDAIKYLLRSEDPDILRSTCAAAAYLTDGPSDRVQMFLEQGICPSIIKLVRHPDPLVVFSSLRAVSNLLSGTDQQSESIIELDVVSTLSFVIKRHKERRIVKEACMALSNIAAGTQSDILKLVEADIVEDLIHISRFAPNDVRMEALWAVGNAVSGAGHDLIKEFTSYECMKSLSSALTTKNPSIIKLALQAIKNLLWCGDFAEDPNFDLRYWDSENDEEFWSHADWLSKAKGFYRLVELRQNPDIEIAQSAVGLLEALIENPFGEYSYEDHDPLSESETEESDYEDLLNTLNSPTAFDAARNQQA